VIAVEEQGHGRIADAHRPITYEQIAGDSVAVLTYVGVDRADVVGFGMDGGIALQRAIRHPAVVRKLVVASAGFATDGMHKTRQAGRISQLLMENGSPHFCVGRQRRPVEEL
jgi:pimeloyl-ACP methyl ester carboxylesterase